MCKGKKNIIRISWISTYITNLNVFPIDFLYLAPLNIFFFALSSSQDQVQSVTGMHVQTAGRACNNGTLIHATATWLPSLVPLALMVRYFPMSCFLNNWIIMILIINNFFFFEGMMIYVTMRVNNQIFNDEKPRRKMKIPVLPERLYRLQNPRRMSSAAALASWPSSTPRADGLTPAVTCWRLASWPRRRMRSCWGWTRPIRMTTWSWRS